MILNVLVVGATGGIGSACCELLQEKKYNVTAWGSKDLDLNFPDRVFAKNLSN